MHTNTHLFQTCKVINPQDPQLQSKIYLVLFRENVILPHPSQPPFSNLKQNQRRTYLFLLNIFELDQLVILIHHTLTHLINSLLILLLPNPLVIFNKSTTFAFTTDTTLMFVLVCFFISTHYLVSRTVNLMVNLGWRNLQQFQQRTSSMWLISFW